MKQALLGFVLLALALAQEEEVDPIEALSEAIPGSPGEDYPIYASPPETTLTCDAKIEGYYADTDADCQAFHVCASDGRDGLLEYSFLCPNGTLFNQQYFICDWWFNVDCSQASEYYSINFEIDAAMKAEKIDLQGSSSDSPNGGTPTYSSSSGTNFNSETDKFRTGPVDYSL